MITSSWRIALWRAHARIAGMMQVSLLSGRMLSDHQDARGDQCDKCSITFSSPTALIHPRCKRNKAHTISVRPSTHACIALDKLQPRLEEWLREAQAKGKWGNNPVITERGEIIEPRMLGGLRPSAVTRDLQWGVAVPEVGIPEEDKVLKDKVICESDVCQKDCC